MEVLEGVRNQQRRGAVVGAVAADGVGRELRVWHQVDAGLGSPLLLARQLVADEPHLAAAVTPTRKEKKMLVRLWAQLLLQRLVQVLVDHLNLHSSFTPILEGSRFINKSDNRL
jgi:hypothetical protein